MPAQVTDVDTLKAYLEGVVTRADHHAGNVNEIALALAGAIVWRKDPPPIEVMQRSGDMKNILWVRIDGQRYAFRYDHETQAIEIRKGNTRGRLIHAFTNDSALSDVRRVFESL